MNHVLSASLIYLMNLDRKLPSLNNPRLSLLYTVSLTQHSSITKSQYHTKYIQNTQQRGILGMVHVATYLGTHCVCGSGPPIWWLSMFLWAQGAHVWFHLRFYIFSRLYFWYKETTGIIIGPKLWYLWLMRFSWCLPYCNNVIVINIILNPCLKQGRRGVGYLVDLHNFFF